MEYTTERYRKWRDSIGRVGGEEKIKLGREERVNRLPSRYTIQTRVIDIDVKGVLASRDKRARDYGSFLDNGERYSRIIHGKRFVRTLESWKKEKRDKWT